MHNAYTIDASTLHVSGKTLEGFATVYHLLRVLRKRALNFFLAVLAFPALAEPGMMVPSGRNVSLHDLFFVDEYDGLTLHAAFLWPDIKDVDLVAEMAITEADMAFLCQNFALPIIASEGRNAKRIVITFSDQPVAFGVATPHAVQVFESYLITRNICEWEAF